MQKLLLAAMALRAECSRIIIHSHKKWLECLRTNLKTWSRIEVRGPQTISFVGGTREGRHEDCKEGIV